MVGRHVWVPAFEHGALDVHIGQEAVQPAGEPPGQSPVSDMSAGMSRSRTMNASTSTPNASAKPMGRMMALSERTKAPNTEIMRVAAAMTSALSRALDEIRGER